MTTKRDLFRKTPCELERKIKYKAETAAATQKQEMTKSTVKMRSGRIVAESEHEEGRLVTEAAAELHSNGTAFGGTTESEQADGRLVEEAAAALDLDEDASTKAAATCALSEDTNAAAEIEKAKRRDVMSKSQENKNEKTSEGDDEIRRLVEEKHRARRKTQTEIIGQEDQKMRQGKKKNKTTRTDKTYS